MFSTDNSGLTQTQFETESNSVLILQSQECHRGIHKLDRNVSF